MVHSLPMNMAGPFHLIDPHEVCFVCCQSTDKHDLIKVGTALIHTYCFRCRECNDYLQKEDFRFEDGRLFCRDCHAILYSRICARCGKSMLPVEIIQINAKSIHRGCLACEFCNKAIKLDRCFKFAGLPFCDEKCALNHSTHSEHAKREKLRTSLRLVIPPGKKKNVSDTAKSKLAEDKQAPSRANEATKSQNDVSPTVSTTPSGDKLQSNAPADQKKNVTEQPSSINKEGRAEEKPKG